MFYGTVFLLKALTHFDESLHAVHSQQGQKPAAVYHLSASPAFWDEYISSEQTVPDI